MTQNATLVVEFDDTSFKFPVSWVNDYFIECEELAEKIFFEPSEEMQKSWDNGGQPEMSVFLNDNPDIKTQVLFESMASLVYPVRNLDKLKAKFSKS